MPPLRRPARRLPGRPPPLPRPVIPGPCHGRVKIVRPARGGRTPCRRRRPTDKIPDHKLPPGKHAGPGRGGTR
ncbi:hypothetical protein GCM10010341_13230 [Streptomyces noursei]|nr:hypothetical protein GCM10010341_13230 [Streptomyces noursei]